MEDTMPSVQLIEQMKSKAETVQAIAKNISTQEDAFRYAVDITQQQGGHNVAAIGFRPQALEILRELCTISGLNLLDPPLRFHADEIHTAVTPVDWGIAETGTLVINASGEDIRLATMLA
jgi:L-lactate dehydrogenase complex protein LldG